LVRVQKSYCHQDSCYYTFDTLIIILIRCCFCLLIDSLTYSFCGLVSLIYLYAFVMVPYWLSAYLWRYWAWKTYHNYSWIYDYIFNQEMPLLNQRPYIISNNPYSINDMFYSSPDEMQNITQFLCDYIRHTNYDHKTYYDYYDSQRPIYFIIDEAHNYFHSRNFANGKFVELLTILSQCRKRKIKFICITQFARQIDIWFRTIADYGILMNQWSILGAPITKCNVYTNPGDLLELCIEHQSMFHIGDNDTRQKYLDSYYYNWSLFREKTFLLQDFAKLRKSYHYLASEIHNTVYVSWFNDHERSLPNMSCYFESDQYKKFYNDLFDWNPPIIQCPPDIDLKTTQSTIHSKSDFEHSTNNYMSPWRPPRRRRD